MQTWFTNRVLISIPFPRSTSIQNKIPDNNGIQDKLTKMTMMDIIMDHGCNNVQLVKLHGHLQITLFKLITHMKNIYLKTHIYTIRWREKQIKTKQNFSTQKLTEFFLFFFCSNHYHRQSTIPFHNSVFSRRASKWMRKIAFNSEPVLEI